MAYSWLVSAATGSIRKALVEYDGRSHGNTKLNGEYGDFKEVKSKPFPCDMQVLLSTPKKEIKLGIRSALSAKLADEQLIVVDKFEFEKPRTKDAVAVLKALGVEEKRCTIVVNDDNTNAILSFRNIPTVDVITSGEENVYELLDNKFLIFEQDALKKLEEAMA